MLVARQTFLRQLVAASDILTLLVALTASYWIRGPAVKAHIGAFSDYFWMLWVIVPVWLLSLWFAGLYRSETYHHITRLVAAVLRAQIAAGLLLLSSMYMTKSVEVSRVLTQLFIAISFCAILVQKLLLHAILERRRYRSTLHVPRVLLVGSAQDSARYIDLVERHASMAAQVVGVLTPADEEKPAIAGVAVMGRPSDLPEILATTVVDEVVVLTRLWPALMQRIAVVCSVRGLVMRLMMDVPRASVGAWRADDCGDGIFFLSLTAVPQDVVWLAIKRGLDMIGGAMGLLLCVMAYFVYGYRLKKESGASPFFKQRRVGHNGRRFTLYKFRTMYSDAESRQQELTNQNIMNGPMFKLRDDPRITPTGRELRKRHLDELPQFWNVLKGEMSLVGTRPPTEDETWQYASHHHRRLSMKPGLTGPWQLQGNENVSSFEQVVKLDCDYIDHWTLRKDFSILIATIRKIVRGDAC
jgi:exopolysaccharide biosynthesis polyprenyl glycosylphosphotransferase